MSDSEAGKATEAAYRFLSTRPRSIFEVRKKLERRGFCDDTIEKVIIKLKELNLLNDEEFALQTVRYLAEVKKYGPYFSAHRLREKGIDARTAEMALNKIYSNVDEKEAARRLILKKAPGRPTSGNEKGKLGRYLQSKGYTWETIKEVLEELDDRKRD